MLGLLGAGCNATVVSANGDGGPAGGYRGRLAATAPSRPNDRSVTLDPRWLAVLLNAVRPR